MPFKITKVKNGYKVKNIDTNKTYSNKPLTKDKANKQLKVLNYVYYKNKK